MPREFYYKLGGLGVFGIEVPEEYGGAGDHVIQVSSAIVVEETRPRRGQLRRLRRAHRPVPALHPQARHRGAEAALAAEVHHRRDDVRDRDDRAGHRFRPGRHAHHRQAVRGRHATTCSTAPRPSSPAACSPTGCSSCARTAPHEGGRPPLRHLAARAWTPSSTGYTVGRKLDKIGLRTSDTAELAFTDVKVPVEDLLGEEGKGFSYLGHNLPQERLAIAVGAYAQAAAAVRFAMEYIKERKVFGKPVAAFQNTKFELADCQAEVDAAQAIADRALEALRRRAS